MSAADKIAGQVWGWLNRTQAPWSPSDAVVSDFAWRVADALLTPLREWREERREPLPDDASDYQRQNLAYAEDVLDRLTHRYRAEPVPPCRVCGGPLKVAAMGGGKRTEYACEDVVMGSDGWLDHYATSKWTEPNSGDGDVLALVALVRELLS